MGIDIVREVAALEQMTVGQLQDRYAEVFGEPVRSRHRQYLIRRIAWRIQALAEGGLSEQALQRAEELANYANVRLTPPMRLVPLPNPSPAATTVCVPVSTDPRLPPPGSVITRKYKDRMITVKVLADGFEYMGQRYRSLTGVAKAVNGSHANGFLFFKLGAKR